ncbi:MAG: M10 family metallopeptidase C-terminal domain-containing protein [Hyphomonadaceae bacterium]
MRLYQDLATGLAAAGNTGSLFRASGIDGSLASLDTVNAFACGCATCMDKVLSYDAGASDRSWLQFERLDDGFFTLRTGDGGPQEQNSGSDTVPGNATTSVVLTIGGSQNGFVNTPGDDDWYRVDLVAGQTYVFTMTGNGGTPLQDTYLELRNEFGALIAIDDDAGPGTDSLLRFTVQETGTYFINARAWEPDTGATLTGGYTISVTSGGPPQNPLNTIDINYQFPDNTINVYFSTAGQTFSGDTATRNWTQTEIDAVMLALDTFEAVTPLVFTQVFSAASADFVLTLADLGTNVLGHFFVGVGHGAFDPDTSSWLAGLAPGSSAWSTVIHEIGHGLGLAHPHDNGGNSEIMQGVVNPFSSYGTFYMNQGVFTMMSYNSGWEFAPWGPNGSLTTGSESTPMALDVAMLQSLYGTNPTTNSGNTTYTLTAAAGSYRAIWDTGGTDTIVFNGSQNATIDLRAATLANETGGGGFVSFVSNFHNGFTIANGVVIENATGGTGNDTLTGNSAANTLTGNAGTDNLNGGDGADTLIGGAGGDTLNGGNGRDRASYLGSAAAVTVNLHTMTATGGDATGDTLISIEDATGTNFDDMFISGTAANDFAGGTGNDTVSYANSAAGVIIDLGSGASWDGSVNDTFSSIEYAIGSAFADTFYGTAGDNRFTGGAGGDAFFGGSGVDTVDYAASAAGVTINFAAGTGSGGEAAGDTFNGVENAIGSNFADTFVSSAAANSFTGGNGNDTLSYAGSANGVIIDLASGVSWDGVVNDTFSSIENAIGGNGADTFYGSNGDNTFTGGLGADTLLGADGVDTADYAGSNAGVTVNLRTGAGAGGHAAGDTYSLIENVTGSGFNDVFVSSFAANNFAGGAGRDTISYAGSTAGVIVDMQAGVSWDGSVNDTFTSIEHIIGGAGNDQLWGDSGDNIINGGTGGSDVLAGFGGFDTVDYSSSATGVIIDMGSGASWDGVVNDFLYAFHGAIGSNQADDFRGTGGVDVIDGGAGADLLRGNDDADSFVFRAGQANGDTIMDFAGQGAVTGDSFIFVGYGTAAQGATFVQINATQWLITSANGLITETITLANGASVHATDFTFVDSYTFPGG